MLKYWSALLIFLFAIFASNASVPAPELFSAGFSYSDGMTPDVIISNHNNIGLPGGITTNGVSEHTFTYNNDTQITNINLTSSLMPSASSAYTYDSNLRRLTFDLRLSDSSALAHSYTYDDAGRLKTVSSGDIEAVYEYVPNAVNLIDTITIKKGGNTVLVRDFDYAPNSNRITSFSNQRPVGSSYDSFSYLYWANTDKISKVTLTDGTVLEYQYDARGQLFGALCKRGALVSSEFAYTSDSITNILEGGRVRFGGVPEFETQPDIFNSIEMRRVGDTVEISGSVKKEAAVSVNNELLERYDSEEFFAIINANNESSAVFLPINVTAAWFDPEAVPEIGGDQPGNVSGADLIATVSETVYMPQNPETPVYDDVAGHLKEDSEKICVWDFENRLLSIESKIPNPEGKIIKVENAYDYAGRRICKKVYENNALVREHYFYYDQILLNGSPADFGILAGETVINHGTTEYQYFWGLDINGSYQGLGGVGGLIAIVDKTNNKTYIPSMDAKGSIHSYIDANSREFAVKYSYDPYGRIIKETGDIDLPFKYQTKYYDKEFALYNFGLRYLQSETCKWLSRDPIQEAGGLNQYAYGNGDPINGIDYLGLALYAFDGTGNDRERLTGETNVSILERVYMGKKHYIPGVGTGGAVDKASGGIFGAGGDARINEMYQKLIEFYNAGDQDIDIIGFSRGAALARAFANKIAKEGIPLKGTSVEYMGNYGNYWAAQRVYPKIRFLGLFDTVASFGIPGNNVNLDKELSISGNVEFTAHAIAADENRTKFPLSSIYGLNEPIDINRKNEKSFRGAHSDIGGGYGDFPEAAYRPLYWMWQQGINHRVPFGPLPAKVTNFLNSPAGKADAVHLHDSRLSWEYWDDIFIDYWFGKRERQIYWNQ